MSLEYETLLEVATDNIRSGISVVLDTPFWGYFSDEYHTQKLKEKFDNSDENLDINLDNRRVFIEMRDLK